MAMDITLTDGGIETRIIYEFKCPIGDFEAYKLLRKEAGRKGERLDAFARGTGQLTVWLQPTFGFGLRDELACASEFDLVILGGCCGTDEHYIDALARAAD